MDWQQPVSLAVVALAGFYVMRRGIRSHRRARSRLCGSDCGCGAGDEVRPEPESSRANRRENEKIAGPGRDAAASPR